MKIGRHKNIPIKISEKDYKKIINRFDYTKYIQVDEYILTTESCVLCDKYYSGLIKCDKCPFYKFETKDNQGCMNVLGDLLNLNPKEDRFSVFYLDVGEIGYREDEEKEAQKELDVVLNFLRSFK